MYKAYLAGLSGEHLQFMSLSEGEAAAFTLGAIDKAHACSRPKSRLQLEEVVTQLVDGEWTTTLTAMQARLNQMQAERDELRDRCDELAETLRERDDLFVPNPEHPVHE